MLADRAMVRSLGWVQSRVLARVVTSSSSGSSDLGMHFVAPTMIRHCGDREKRGMELSGAARVGRGCSGELTGDGGELGWPRGRGKGSAQWRGGS